VAGVDGGLAWEIAEESSRDGNRAVAVRCLWPHGCPRRNDIKLPRKIKDVKPVYPVSALPGASAGAVLIGGHHRTRWPVRETRLLRSVVTLLTRRHWMPLRRWEYEPTTLNGMRWAVVITVVVNFALQ